MSELPPREQLALHEFSVRYRAGYYNKHPFAQTSFHTVSEAITEQYEQEQQAKRSPSIEPTGSEPEQEQQPSKPQEPEQPQHSPEEPEA